MTTDEIMELVDAFGVSCAHTSDVKFSANRDAQVFRANIANAVRKLANAPEAPAPAPNALDAEIVKDAERYRWLAAKCRSTSEHWGGRWSIVVDGPAPATSNSEDDFDAAIDAAIAAQSAWSAQGDGPCQTSGS